MLQWFRVLKNYFRKRRSRCRKNLARRQVGNGWWTKISVKPRKLCDNRTAKELSYRWKRWTRNGDVTHHERRENSSSGRNDSSQCIVQSWWRSNAQRFITGASTWLLAVLFYGPNFLGDRRKSNHHETARTNTRRWIVVLCNSNPQNWWYDNHIATGWHY